MATTERWADIVDEEEASGSSESSVSDVTSKLAKSGVDKKPAEQDLDATDGDHYSVPASGGEIVVQASSADSPIVSEVQSFDELGLPEKLKENIYKKKYRKPSKIQAQALPLIVGHRGNLIAQSQTGTGKTAAFCLAMLAHVDTSQAVPQAVCLSPTRELARYIYEEASSLAVDTGITLTLVVKDAPSTKSSYNLREHIVVGTPGSLKSLFNRAKNRRLQKTIKVLCLDEADKMISQGSFKSDSLFFKTKTDPQKAQMLLFSATYTERVRKFAEGFIRKPFTSITLKREEMNVSTIKQYYYECADAAGRYAVLDTIYSAVALQGQTLVFMKTRAEADALEKQMSEEAHSVALLHGGLTADQRDKIRDEFRDQKVSVLICTDVLQRGYDNPNVTFVINYDVPTLPGTSNADAIGYLHRIGRCGRFGQKGLALTFVHDLQGRRHIAEIADYLKKEIKPLSEEELVKLQQLNSE